MSVTKQTSRNVIGRNENIKYSSATFFNSDVDKQSNISQTLALIIVLNCQHWYSNIGICNVRISNLPTELKLTFILVTLLRPNRFIFTGDIHKIIVRSMIVHNHGVKSHVINIITSFIRFFPIFYI